jgi:hypothetical protein
MIMFVKNGFSPLADMNTSKLPLTMDDDDVVPDSDPYAPPLDWVPLLPTRYTERPRRESREITIISKPTTSLDDIVPDSDPPYPPWMEVLIPYEPRISSTSQDTVRREGNLVDAVRDKPKEENLVWMKRTECVYEEMVDTVETLFTMSPARYSYTPVPPGRDVVTPTQEGAVRTSASTPVASYHAADCMEEPNSEDEREYKRMAEHEIYMDGLKYGCPSPLEDDSWEPPTLPPGTRAASPTSDDEREWSRQMNGPQQISIQVPTPRSATTTKEELEYNDDDNEQADCDSDFEEAQRPPWFTSRMQAVAEVENESSEDEVVSSIDMSCFFFSAFH